MTKTENVARLVSKLPRKLAQSEFVSSPEDRALVAELLAGNEQAFSGLVDRYHASMVRLAMAFVSSRSVAEEVAQDAWMGLLTGLREFEWRSSVKTWLFRILTNRAKTRGVREGRFEPFSALGRDDEAEPAVSEDRFTSRAHWASPPVSWAEDTPESLVMRQETLAVVSAAIERLPPTQRAVILLRDIEGADSAEVCDVLEITEINQRVLLHRARSQVRQVIEEHMGRT